MRAAIVGCGGIARVHAASIAQIAGFELAACADCKFERAEEFASAFGGKPYSSLEEMLMAEEIDVLHICTPHYLHVPMAVYGLERGVHVFMEKPPVISYEQLDQLREVTHKTDRRLGFCFQNRYNPSFLRVKRILEEGGILLTPADYITGNGDAAADTGRVSGSAVKTDGTWIPAGTLHGGRGLVTWDRQEAYYTESGWRGSLETEGGGALINQSVHTLDLLACLLGTPDTADASMSNHHLKGVIEVEDTMEAYIRFGSRTACFYATTAYCDDRPPLIEFKCDNMTIRLEDMEVTLYLKDGRRVYPSIESRVTLGKSYWGSGHKDCIEDFYRSVTEGTQFAQDLAGMDETIRLMLAVYESARSGREITL